MNSNLSYSPETPNLGQIRRFLEPCDLVGSNLTGSLPNPGELTWRNPPCVYSFSFNTIEEACVTKQLKWLPPESHLDVLDMDTRLFSCGASLLAPSVTALSNRSLFSSTLPKDWKLARVIPIYRGKGPKTEESNFRPISILGTPSMIIERQVQSPLIFYFIKHDLNTINQFAFLKNHSIVTCLHRIIDDWYEAINEGEYIMSFFSDVQKCFDSINHDILIKSYLCIVYKAPNLPCLRII